MCRTADVRAFQTVVTRRYWRCRRCVATFLDPAQRPEPRAAAEHYRTHRNHADDPRYRAFLARLADPLLARLDGRSSGLDFGCGPAPGLAAMLADAGHAMAVYDPLFAADTAVLGRIYDFVTLTEVAEHLHDPAATFDQLAGLVRPGGWLAVMTCFQTDDDRFAAWHYRRDPTHVVFYRRETFAILAGLRGWRLEVPRKDVALLRTER